MDEKLAVTVCVPVKNEEKNLARCLEAIGSAFMQVVVIDSGSEDATCSIAREHGAEVVHFEWDGKFPKKRNWCLRNYVFQTDWVLFLDADEIISPAFIAEITSVVKQDRVVGCWLNYSNWFMGCELKHGDKFRKLAFFKRSAGEYERFPEDAWTHLDMEVHEHPVLEGPLGEVQSLIEHKDYRGLKHYIGKHNEYSDWEMRRYLWLEEADLSEWEGLNSRQQFKYKHLKEWWFAPFYFFVTYVAKFGFLDGVIGWRFASMKYRYFSDIRFKILEAKS
ncbi:glycosyltransferase family 2 protein [Rubritalea spongiae]|uniref:Glycosyltransferase family 2 protein n=1 Tax=Rubritalea spongiae TaxID=430797 RepID=A0ABW5E1D8_9BACT